MQTYRLSIPAPIETNPLKREELNRPTPGPHQVLLRVNMCGVCHTDLHIVEGDIHPPDLPIIPGHQVIGVAEEIGAEVSLVQPGQRVGVPWLYWTCGACEFCLRGEENLCVRALFTGFHMNGGYAEFMLADEKFLLPIPDELSSPQAAPLLCAGIIGYRSLRKADVQPGEHIGLFGFGASAHLAIQVANYWGCEVSVFTRSSLHRQHAEDLGAAWVGGAEDNPPGQLDRAVIFAPAGGLVPAALKKLRPGGTLAVNAIHMSPIPEMPYGLIYGERTMRSVANATYHDGLDLLKLAVEIPIQASVNLYPLEACNQALQDLKTSRFQGEAVLVLE